MTSGSKRSVEGSNVPELSVGRAYTASEAARILGLSMSVFNSRVREGFIAPVFPCGDRIFSGFELARLLRWPLSDDPADYGHVRADRLTH